jgi:hypothetical protein
MASNCAPFAENQRLAWNLHNLGAAYGQKPSSYLGLEGDSWEAYQVDLLCLTVGRDVEERIRKKRPLPWQQKVRPGKSGFTRLGGRARKVKVPESGIW